MKDNVLEYKGYHTMIAFDAESFILRGKIEGISDLVTFESNDPRKIYDEFKSAVDDYLSFCREVGKDPDKEYRGSFNIRIDPVLHRKAALLASKNGDTLNNTVEKAIQAYVDEKSVTNSQFRETVKIIAETLATENIYNAAHPNPYGDSSKIVPLKAYKGTEVKFSYQTMGEN